MSARLNRRVLRRWGDVALWVGSILGVMCILVAIAGLLFDIRPLVFRSGSMSPSIETGALAFSQKVSGDDLQKGDVISVVNGNDVRITHRIQEITPENDAFRVILKGDANATADTEPYRVESAYRVFADVPKLGYVANALTKPAAIFAGGVLAALVLAVAFYPGAGRESAGVGRRRALSLVLVAGLCSTTLGSVGTSKTFAAFSDTSALTTGTFTALTVPAPTAPTCTTTGFILTTANVSWTSAGPNYSYFYEVRRVSNNAFVVSGTTTATTIPFTVGLLGNLLSTNFVVKIQAFPTGVPTWLSGGSISRTFRSLALGLGTACS